MEWNLICTVYLKELKESLRDRRALISMIVIPTIVVPLLMVGFLVVKNKLMKSARDENSSLVILGGADSPEVVTSLKSEKKLLVIESNENYKKLISDKKIRVAVDISPGFDAALKAGKPTVVIVYYYEGEIKSEMGRDAVNEFLASYRTKIIADRIAEQHLPVNLLKPFESKMRNVAPPEKVGGNALGGVLPNLIVILCLTGAMYPAIDLTSGERERGTMETLLCSPVNRINLVLGKFLMVLTASVTTMVISMVSMSITVTLGVAYFAGYAGAEKATKPDVIPLIDPLGLLGVFAITIPMAVFFAALLLTIALLARSSKEANSYISPLMIVVFIPAGIAVLPGVDLSVKTALIPILNISLVSKEMLSGVWNWNYIALIFSSLCLYAAIALALCAKIFNREDVMFRA